MDCADLPYTQDGQVPDILFNSHGIPSRMTMGQMWESLLGKLNALVGVQGGGFAADRCGIPFTGSDDLVANFQRLHDAGFPRMGRELMYSGVSGEPLDGPVYIGCVFYQRLRHMVQTPGNVFFCYYYYL
jgi:DNA-directed RNA polymerase beta subunit